MYVRVYIIFTRCTCKKSLYYGFHLGRGGGTDVNLNLSLITPMAKRSTTAVEIHVVGYYTTHNDNILASLEY